MRMYPALILIQCLRHSLEINFKKKWEFVDIGDVLVLCVWLFVVWGFLYVFFNSFPKEPLAQIWASSLMSELVCLA